jgi:hypothetical protein
MALVVVSIYPTWYHGLQLMMEPDVSSDVLTSSTCSGPRQWNQTSCAGCYAIVVLIGIWSVYNKGRKYPLEGLMGFEEMLGALGVMTIKYRVTCCSFQDCTSSTESLRVTADRTSLSVARLRTLFFPSRDAQLCKCLTLNLPSSHAQFLGCYGRLPIIHERS